MSTAPNANRRAPAFSGGGSFQGVGAPAHVLAHRVGCGQLWQKDVGSSVGEQDINPYPFVSSACVMSAAFPPGRFRATSSGCLVANAQSSATWIRRLPVGRA